MHPAKPLSKPPSRQTDATAAAAHERGWSIGSERVWRAVPDEIRATRLAESAVLVTRWRCRKPSGPLTHRTPSDRHLIAIVLSVTHVRFAQGGIVLHDGRLSAGAVQISRAGSESAASFDAPCDVLHLHVPQHLVAQQYEQARGTACVPASLFEDNGFFLDPEIERLGNALLTAHMETAIGSLYAEALTRAIVTRILARESLEYAGSATAHDKRNRLPKWRLHRAVDFIEANLALPIQLDEISASAGLTKMHFATQFRQSTGLSPHAYVTRRRIRKAKALLTQSQFNILEVAQCCGFATHAHFSSVFKKATGYSPSQWRLQFNGPRTSMSAPAASPGELLALHELNE